MFIICMNAFIKLPSTRQKCEHELRQFFSFGAAHSEVVYVYVYIFPFLLAVTGAVRCGGGSVCVCDRDRD